VIRLAKIEDVPELVRLFVSNHERMKCAWSVDTARLAETFRRAIISPDSLCFTGDECLLLAVCFDSPLGAGKLAQELCISASPGNLDALIALYEQWARSKGCRAVSLGCEQRHSAFARLYGARGYRTAETTFSKEIA
jgi:hypothetical protein